MHLYNDTLNNMFNHFKLPFKELYIGWQEITEWNVESILNNILDKAIVR